MKKIVFSGIQPSSTPTIGNYIGALKQWVQLQKKFSCIYCIVDLHTITKKQNPLLLRNSILDTLALYLACGIDFKKNIIFIQSHVSEHSQLSWILNCFTYFSTLNRMTQFKEMYKKSIKSSINVGLFNYPVLMASDILLYQTDIVPVGEDQKQHLEFTRNLSKKFNLIYGNIFKLPQIFLPKIGKKIMSLTDPSKKMSKSDICNKNFISLLENPILIEKKISKATTDSDNPPKIYYNPEKKAGISNLLTILSVFSKKTILELENELKKKDYIYLKKIVLEELQHFLYELQKKYLYFRKNEDFLYSIINTGAKKARKKAKKTLKKVFDAIGFI